MGFDPLLNFFLQKRHIGVDSPLRTLVSFFKLMVSSGYVFIIWAYELLDVLSLPPVEVEIRAKLPNHWLLKRVLSFYSRFHQGHFLGTNDYTYCIILRDSCQVVFLVYLLYILPTDVIMPCDFRKGKFILISQF